MKIQAALAHSNKSPLSIEEIDLVEPGPNDILVKITATGLCHTDLTVLNNAPLPWPAVLGHEGAGIVEKVGSNVTKVAAGDSVIMTTASCGKCKTCLEGQPSYCLNFRDINMSGGYCADGSCSHSQNDKPVFARFFGQSSFATYSLTTERSIIKMDSDLPLDLMAPLGCGIQTGAAAVFNTLQVHAGSSIVIFGAGAVGLSGLMAAKIAGSSTIIAVDMVDSRLQLATELGATHVINAGNEDVLAKIAEITGGGADYTVDATGIPAVMTQAIHALGYNGVTALVGIAGADAEVTFNPTLVQSKRLEIRGSIMAGAHTIPEFFIQKLVGFWRDGLFPFEKLVTFYEFDQINEAIHAAEDGSAIKPILRLPA
jgi:aryl-alcohol dehydrogenase